MHTWYDLVNTYSYTTDSNLNADALCDLSHLGLLKISGPDATKFLQGQLTCQMENVSTCMGAHCNPQGRVLSLFYLFAYQNAYYLILPPNMVTIAKDALKKYAVFYKVELIDASHTELIMIGVKNKNFSNVANNIITIEVTPKRHILIAALSTMQTQWQILAQTSQIITNAHWEYLDIQDGIPTIYPETSAKFLPHDINLQSLNALNFNKGCYTGQEIIARMHYRGKLKKHMYTLQVDAKNLPPLGECIDFAEGTSGIVVNARPLNADQYAALVITDENTANNHLLK